MHNGRPRLTSWVRVLVLVVAVAVTAAACSSGDDGVEEAGDGPSIGESEGLTSEGGDMPSSEFAMSDGTMATFADFLDGKPLVVNYIASWCPPCRAEMPDFQAVYTDVKDEVTFLSIALQDTPEATAELVADTGVQYPWGQDPSGAMYAELGGFAMPTTFYVDADGSIVGRDNGMISEDALRNRLTDLFGVTA